MSESETGRETILAVGAACGEPVRKALLELLDIFEGQVKRAYAHELAEKIRADLDATGDWTCCAQARSASADLVDPKKESTR